MSGYTMKIKNSLEVGLFYKVTQSVPMTYIKRLNSNLMACSFLLSCIGRVSRNLVSLFVSLFSFMLQGQNKNNCTKAILVFILI